MKTKRVYFYILMVSVSLFGVACSSDVDEVPPRTNNEFKTYVLPKETRLSTEERNYIEERMNEYEEAIK